MRRALPTRRKRALRWWGISAGLLGALWLLLPLRLTPAAAHRQALADALANPAETLCEAETPVGSRLILSKNADVVCLGSYQRDGWLNWTGPGLNILTRKAERPFAFGYRDERVRSGRDPDVYTTYPYVFGCVWDPAVKTLVVRLEVFDSPQAFEQTVTLTAEDLETGADGERWFLLPLEPEMEMNAWRSSVTAYDSGGAPLGKQWGTGSWAEDDLP